MHDANHWLSVQLHISFLMPSNCNGIQSWERTLLWVLVGETTQEEDGASCPQLCGLTGEQTAQPWGMYLYNNAESVACPSLMKQIAWENYQANAWQLSHYIRNPVPNTPLLKCVLHVMCASSPFHVEGNVPSSEAKPRTLAAWKGNIITFQSSLWGRSGQEVFLSATTCLGPTGRQPCEGPHR